MINSFPDLTNIAVHCQSIKDAKELITILHFLHFKWQDGDQIEKDTLIWPYAEDTAYNIIQGSLGNFKEFISNGYLVLDFKTFKKAFLNNHYVKWHIEAIFDAKLKTYKYRLFKRFLCFKFYLKQDSSKVDIPVLEDAIRLSHFLKYFKLKSRFYAKEN